MLGLFNISVWERVHKRCFGPCQKKLSSKRWLDEPSVISFKPDFLTASWAGSNDSCLVIGARSDARRGWERHSELVFVLLFKWKHRPVLIKLLITLAWAGLTSSWSSSVVFKSRWQQLLPCLVASKRRPISSSVLRPAGNASDWSFHRLQTWNVGVF